MGYRIIHGEFKTGAELKKAKELFKASKIDFKLVDQEVHRVLWTFTNLFSGCVIKTIEGIRLKKKFFWDQAKTINRHWLAANMNGEAFFKVQRL